MKIIEEIYLSPLQANEVDERKGTLLTGKDHLGKTIKICKGVEHIKLGDPVSGFPCDCGSVYCHPSPLRISKIGGDVLLTKIDETESRIGIEEPKFFYAMPAVLIRGALWNQLAAQFPNLRPVNQLATIRRRDLSLAWWSELEEHNIKQEEFEETISIGNTWEKPQLKAAINAVLRWGEENPEEPVTLHRVEDLDVEVEQLWRGTYRVLCWNAFVRTNSGSFHLHLNGLAPLPLLSLSTELTHNRAL